MWSDSLTRPILANNLGRRRFFRPTNAYGAKGSSHCSDAVSRFLAADFRSIVVSHYLADSLGLGGFGSVSGSSAFGRRFRSSHFDETLRRAYESMRSLYSLRL